MAASVISPARCESREKLSMLQIAIELSFIPVIMQGSVLRTTREELRRHSSTCPAPHPRSSSSIGDCFLRFEMNDDGQDARFPHILDAIKIVRQSGCDGIQTLSMLFQPHAKRTLSSEPSSLIAIACYNTAAREGASPPR